MPLPQTGAGGRNSATGPPPPPPGAPGKWPGGPLFLNIPKGNT